LTSLTVTSPGARPVSCRLSPSFRLNVLGTSGFQSKSNDCSVSSGACLTTVNVASSRSVNVQTTVSPGWMVTSMWPPSAVKSASPVSAPLSVQTISSKFQSSGTLGSAKVNVSPPSAGYTVMVLLSGPPSGVNVKQA